MTSRDIYAGFLRVLECPLPTIAAVNGARGRRRHEPRARVRRADRRAVSARFDTAVPPHRASIPGGGHTWLLDRAVGPQAAAAMNLFGERLDGERGRADRAGLGVRPDDELARPGHRARRPGRGGAPRAGDPGQGDPPPRAVARRASTTRCGSSSNTRCGRSASPSSPSACRRPRESVDRADPPRPLLPTPPGAGGGRAGRGAAPTTKGRCVSQVIEPTDAEALDAIPVGPGPGADDRPRRRLDRRRASSSCARSGSSGAS